MTATTTAPTSPIFRGNPVAEDARRVVEASITEPANATHLDRQRLRDICLAAGASDVGFVEIGRAGLGEEADRPKRIAYRRLTTPG